MHPEVSKGLYEINPGELLSVILKDIICEVTLIFKPPSQLSLSSPSAGELEELFSSLQRPSRKSTTTSARASTSTSATDTGRCTYKVEPEPNPSGHRRSKRTRTAVGNLFQ